MNYYVRVFLRSVKEVWDVVVSDSVRTTVVGAVILFTSGYVTFLIKGLDTVKDYIFAAEVTLGVTVSLFVILFLFKFLFLAPKDLFLEQRREKERAIADLESEKAKQLEAPLIAGFWKRNMYGTPGILELQWAGNRLTGIFRESTVTQTYDGGYNAQMRCFEVMTTRRDSRIASGEPFHQKETWWMAGSEMFVFYVERDFNGLEARGIMEKAH